MKQSFLEDPPTPAMLRLDQQPRCQSWFLR